MLISKIVSILPLAWLSMLATLSSCRKHGRALQSTNDFIYESLSPWPSDIAPSPKGLTPRNATMWVIPGTPVGGDCLTSESLGPPKEVQLPVDVCMRGTFRNVSLLLREGAICPDGKEAWLAMYLDPNCHASPFLVAWPVLPPNYAWCVWLPPFWEAHLVRMFSTIFRCVDAVEREPPRKVMDSDLDEPVVEDPPELGHGFQRGGTQSTSLATQDSLYEAYFRVAIIGSIAIFSVLAAGAVLLCVVSCFSRLFSHRKGYTTL